MDKKPLKHPPWRSLAEELLKGKDPNEFQRLRKAGKLEAHLDGLVKRAVEAYGPLVSQLEKKQPGARTWALKAAEEYLVRDLLDPTT